VDKECTLHNSIILAICVSKIIKFGEDLTNFWQKQVGSFLAHPVCLMFVCCRTMVSVSRVPWYSTCQKTRGRTSTGQLPRVYSVHCFPCTDVLYACMTRKTTSENTHRRKFHSFAS